jgi:hemerythrin-like metal-binding protein
MEHELMNRVTELVEWNEGLATGVPEIDEQHMILVHTLNEASALFAKDNSIETLECITQDLLSYALYHFDTEESLMQEYGYKEESDQDAELHLAQHRSFSEKVVKVREGLKSATPITPKELMTFLNQWLVNHIQNTDRKLAAYIIEKRSLVSTD